MRGVERPLLTRILHRPEALLGGTFAGLILVGALLLCLPTAHGARDISFLDALFTATSATCVTGLITVDTATDYSRFGQAVILVLIQLGGLGIMTFGILAAQVFHMRASFSSQAALQSVFFEEHARHDLRRDLRRILALTVIVETAGAALLHAQTTPPDTGQGDWFGAVFHAVSAFCNAGFSLRSENAVAFRGSPVVLLTLMALIVIGGLGYIVLLEALGRAWSAVRRRRDYPVRWSLHTRVVLRMSGVLIVGGAAVLFLFDFRETPNAPAQRLLHACFQSVSARTAGFNTVDVGALPLPSLLILVGLMFIGGSPGSCAGGIKTTTFRIWAARMWARLTGRERVTLGERHVPLDVVRRAALIVAVAALWNAAGVMLLAIAEGGRPGVRLEQLIFEQVSAFGTVGLSCGSPGLTVSLAGTFGWFGKLWIAATMFVGRVGPLTVALAVLAPPRPLYEYPTERVMIG